jgi:hypothetical protein
MALSQFVRMDPSQRLRMALSLSGADGAIAGRMNETGR